MNFEEFQNQSRLYVIGALEPAELEEFERERKKSGKKAEDFVTQCYALHELFTLSLRTAAVSAVKERAISIVPSENFSASLLRSERGKLVILSIASTRFL